MRIPLKLLAVSWLVVAALLSILSFKGGDTSIIAGWLYLLWTAPFGVVWWFWLYDIVLTWLPASVAQPVGVIVVDTIAFAFWFLVLPRVYALRTRGRAV